MNIDQKYRVRRIVLDSENGKQFAALTFAPISETPQQANANAAAAGAGGAGGASRSQDFTMTGIPVEALGDVSLDSAGKFVFQPSAE